MSLDRFFAAAAPFLKGESDVETFLAAAGPTPSPKPDLAFYPWLVAFDQQRILAELCPTARTLVDRTDGLTWGALVEAYVAEVMPSAWSVPGLGEGLADWLTARREAHPEQPVALECLVDLYWTRFVARTAPDDIGVGMDRRLHLRHYPVDVLALELHLLGRGAAPEERASTLVVFRHANNLDVRHLVPSLVTLAVFGQVQGQTLGGPLADVPEASLQAELARLITLGVLPETTAL